MKKTALFPVLLGLLLSTACSQDNSKVASSNSKVQPDATKADSQTRPAFAATDPKPTAASAGVVSAAPQSQAPAPAMTDTKEATPTIEPSPPTAKPATPPSATPPADHATPVNPAAITARIVEWKLGPEDIKAEFERTGRIERTKPPELGAPTGPMDGSMITHLVRGRLEGDPELAPLGLSIVVKGDLVTLSGTVHGYDQIGRAVALALDTEGVNKAVSIIKLN